jgi:hypothetical protein
MASMPTFDSQAKAFISTTTVMVTVASSLSSSGVPRSLST